MNIPTKYILYCAQQANFQTRSMLIPYDLIMKCLERVKDLQVLRENTLHNVSFDHNGKKYVVDQLLIENITWNGNLGTYDETIFRNIISDLTGYANLIDDDCYFKEYDIGWSGHIISGIASKGFNHVVNYCNFRNKTEYKGTPIEIVEGFLVLEKNNNKLRMPSVDTVEEMFDKYYPELLETYQHYKDIQNLQ